MELANPVLYLAGAGGCCAGHRHSSDTLLRWGVADIPIQFCPVFARLGYALLC